MCDDATEFASVRPRDSNRTLPANLPQHFSTDQPWRSSHWVQLPASVGPVAFVTTSRASALALSNQVASGESPIWS